MKKTIILFLLAAILSSCASGSKSSAPESAPQEAKSDLRASGDLSMNDAAPKLISENYETGAIRNESFDTAIPPSERQAERKIIKNANINMETDDFDTTVASIRSITRSKSGYFENSQVNTITKGTLEYRNFNATLRVPVDNYEFVKESIEKLAVLIDASENSEEVTGEYYDTQSRLATKVVEEERLLELIERTEKLEDLIALESRLSEVRTEIEINKSRLKNIDSLSAYSTISVYLKENLEASAITSQSQQALGERIKEGFSKSIKFLHYLVEIVLVFISYTIIPLILIVAVTFIIINIIKKLRVRK